MAKHWHRVALAIAKKTGKRVGVDAATRIPDELNRRRGSGPLRVQYRIQFLDRALRTSFVNGAPPLKASRAWSRLSSTRIGRLVPSPCAYSTPTGARFIPRREMKTKNRADPNSPPPSSAIAWV